MIYLAYKYVTKHLFLEEGNYKCKIQNNECVFQSAETGKWGSEQIDGTGSDPISGQAGQVHRTSFYCDLHAPK